VLGLFIAGLALSALVGGMSLFAPLETRGAPGGRRIRFWTLQLAGFGGVGTGLALAGVAGPVALLVALLASGVLAQLVNPLLDEASGEVELGWLSGAAGRVVLPIDAGLGKVAVLTERGRVELPARSDDGRPIARGTPVFVAFVEEGRATVVDLRAITARGPGPR